MFPTQLLFTSLYSLVDIQAQYSLMSQNNYGSVKVWIIKMCWLHIILYSGWCLQKIMFPLTALWNIIVMYNYESAQKKLFRQTNICYKVTLEVHFLLCNYSPFYSSFFLPFLSGITHQQHFRNAKPIITILSLIVFFILLTHYTNHYFAG